jgi:DNA repair protein NreA
MRAVDLPPEIRKKMAPKISESFFGPSPSVFVGHFGYPNVFAGPLGALEERQDIDSPANWLGKSYADIIELRSLLVRTKQKQSIFSRDRFTSDIQDLSMAINSPDIEVGFKKKPQLKISFSNFNLPMGPAGMIDSFKVVENPKIPQSVEYIAKDDLKAAQSAFSLYDKGLDVYKITTILSSGTLGIKKKLVPTRWSITATDDIIGKSLLSSVREFRQLDDFLVFESERLDNHFVILLMPGAWEFENFEAWAQGQNDVMLGEEYEPFEGRKEYAMNQAGGYYASRLAIIEHLYKMKRQARVLAVREISEGYSVPLGVWQVRENVRSAMARGPIRFQSLAESLQYMKAKLRWPLDRYLKKSRMLAQKKITDWV